MPSPYNRWIRTDLAAVRSAPDSRTKGERLEALIGRLFCDIPGLTLEDQDVLNAYATEEIDLYFWNEAKPLRFLDCPLIVECKGWSSPVSGRELRSFAVLLKDKGRANGIFFALEGVAGDAASTTAGFFHIAAAMAGGQTVLVITGADLEAINAPTDLIRLLRRRMLDQVKGQVLAIEGTRRKARRSPPKPR